MASSLQPPSDVAVQCSGLPPCYRGTPPPAALVVAAITIRRRICQNFGRCSGNLDVASLQPFQIREQHPHGARGSRTRQSHKCTRDTSPRPRAVPLRPEHQLLLSQSLRRSRVQPQQHPSRRRLVAMASHILDTSPDRDLLLPRHQWRSPQTMICQTGPVRWPQRRRGRQLMTF